MTSYQIIHLSDLHFSKFHSSIDKRNIIDIYKYQKYLKKHLKDDEHFNRRRWLTSYSHGVWTRLAKQLSEELFKDQKIIITGDISCSGTKEDLNIAKQNIDVKPIIDGVADVGDNFTINSSINFENDTIFLIPGNHDRYKDVKASPGGVEFGKILNKYWDDKTKVNELVLGDDPHRPNDEKLALIGVDFSLESKSQVNQIICPHFSLYGQGYAGKCNKAGQYSGPVLELIDKTKDVKQRYPGTPVVWVMHFLLTPLNDNPCLQLINSKVVKKAAIELGVQIILSGHTHKHLDYPNSGKNKITYIGAGSATSVSNKFSFNKINFLVENGNIRAEPTEWVYDGEMECFLPHGL